MKKKFGYPAATLALLLGLGVLLVCVRMSGGLNLHGAGMNPAPINSVESPRCGQPDERSWGGGTAGQSEQGGTGALPQGTAGAEAAEGAAGTEPGADAPPVTAHPGSDAASGVDRTGETPGRIPGSSPESRCWVEVAVVGEQGEILFGPARVTVSPDNKWGLTALGALEATGLRYMTHDVYYQTSKYHNFVVCVEGQANEGMSGWMYRVNEEIPLRAANEKKIEPGDRVIWWYSPGVGSPAPSWENLKVGGSW